MNDWTDERSDRLATMSAQNTANIANLTRRIEAFIQVAEQDRKDMRDLQLEVRRLVEELRQKS